MALPAELVKLNLLKPGGQIGLTLEAGVTVFLFLDLREAYIPNLSLLACLEPFEKVPGGG